jgi:peptide/nickel transport system substrate-binding protein
MKRTGILLSFALILLMIAGNAFASGGQSGTPSAGSTTGAVVDVNALPRNETLYYNGLQWGTPAGANPFGNVNNAFTTAGHRQLVFETLFTYNLLDGKLYPQIGDSYSWNGQTLTIQLNRNVRFSDGTPCTAADVVYTYELGKRYAVRFSGYWTYISSVTAQGDYTVVIQGNPANFNPKYVEQSISELQITSRAYWERQNLGSDTAALINFMGWDCPGTGPYKPYFWDDTKLILLRVDTYWGQHASRYGKLPAPKYIAHNIYKDNTAGDEAFQANQVDMSQQFITQVWRMWERGAPIETYIPQPPYYFPGVIPMIIFNTTKPGLDDPAVRRAIAMVLDYDMIGVNAMSGYTAKMIPSLMLPTPAEQALIDANALKPYQWEGIDIAGANALLDRAGWVRGADGIRAKGGVRLSFRAECPYGWADWNASLEVVAQAGRQIGMDITTYFPETPVWQNDKDNCTFDILMDSPGGAGIASPWIRAYAALGSMSLPPVGTPNRVQNWGRWENQRANQIITQLAVETNAATLKALWTELNIIYLQEMPTAGLMYRPWVFHTVNTSVWTGFPRINDGSNIPPTILCDGYGIKGLYNLRLK